MRKQEAKHVRATWRLTTIVHGDTLTSLAKKHGVSWKKLARVNNIKAPYSLTSGEQILVPVKKANKNDKNS
jgi:LysM repeat protein